VVFIEAELGGGKTELLGAIGKALHQTKPTPKFIAGYFNRGEYKHYSLHWREPICLRRALIATGGLGSLLGFFPVQYAFAASLIGQAIETCVGTQEFVTDFTREPQEREQYAQQLKMKLRREAEENPTIGLLDDWDEAQRDNWDSMLHSFAREIAAGLPMLIFVTVKSPINLDTPEKGGPSEVIKSLFEKGLAELWRLEKLSPEDIATAIGPCLPSIAMKLHGVTGGNARWVRDVWREWRLNEIVVVNDGDRWLWNPQRASSMNLYADIVEHRLKRILKDHPVMEIEQVREVLACAALEGPQFTADAVAWALNWNRDELIDLLDQLVQSEKNLDGILLDEGFVSIPNVKGDSPPLCLYSFVSDLHWFALDRFGFANEPRSGQRGTERNEKSRALIEGLIEVYKTEERLVAAPLARLLRAVGDSAAAKHYQEMASYAVGREMMRDHALSLLTIDKTDWEQWECERASRFLLAAGQYMRGTFPYEESLSVFDEAACLARRAKNRSLEAWAIYFSSENFSSGGRYAEATERAAIALATFRELGNRRGEAMSLNSLADIYYAEGRYDDARESASLSLMINKAIDNQVGVASSLGQLANIDFLTGCLGDARERATQSLARYRDINDQQGESSILFVLAMIESHESKYGDAREHATRALVIDQQCGSRQRESAVLYLLAQIEHREGNYNDAREQAMRSLAIAQEIGHTVCEVASLCFLAELARDEGKYVDARDRITRSLTICQKIGNREFEAGSLHTLAKLDRDQGRYREARMGATRALAICEEIGYPLYEAGSLQMLAQLDYDEGKNSDAKDRATLTVAIFRDLGYRVGEVRSLLLLAQINRDEAKFTDARERASLCLAISVEIGNRELEASALDSLSQIDREEGKYVEARERASQSLAISRQIGRPAGEAAALHSLAQVDLDEGRSGDARERAALSLAIAREIGNHRHEMKASQLLAQIDLNRTAH
jgi:tetratricopeptide (TPR) repeat protein